MDNMWVKYLCLAFFLVGMLVGGGIMAVALS